jgi:hypothetical protein
MPHLRGENMTDKEILDLFGLSDRTIKTELDLDLEYVIDNGIEAYLKKEQEHENKKKEFMQLFRECFQDIVYEFEKDPKQQIAVNCLECRYNGRLDLSKQYGKSKKD